MAYRDEVVADSPVAYWRVGESAGSVAADEQGAHAGSYVNTPTLGVAGAVVGNTAASFAAAQSEYLATTVLGTLGANLLTSSWEFWIKTTTTGQGVVFGTFNTGASLAIQLQLNRSAADAIAVGKTRLFLRGTNGSQTYGEIATNIYDGAWHHVVVVVTSDTTFKVRVDKVDATVTYALQQSIASAANFEFAVAIAARNLRGVIDNYADVTLDELAFYPTRLSDARIDAHYDAADDAGGTETVTPLRPNATVSNAWTLTGAATAHAALDEVVTQPTAPSTASDHVSSSTAAAVCEVAVADHVVDGDVTQTKLWVYAAGGAKRSITVDLRHGSTSLGTVTVPAAAVAGWVSVTSAVALTQTQVNDLRCRLTCNSTAGGGGASAVTAYAAYVDLTTVVTGPPAESGGSIAPVTATAAGTGVGSEAASGGASTTATAQAIGGGVAAQHESGGALSTVAATASGGGDAAESITDGSLADVVCLPVGGGTGLELVVAGQVASVSVAPTGAGSGTEVATAGSVATVTALAVGGGTAQQPQHEFGGSFAPVVSTATGVGSALEAILNGSTTAVEVLVDGEGVPFEMPTGGASTNVTTLTAGAGAGAEQAVGGSTTEVSTTSAGSGTGFETNTGGSGTTTIVTSSGGGSAITGATGGSIGGVDVTSTGTGVAVEAGGDGAVAVVFTTPSGGGSAYEFQVESGGAEAGVVTFVTGGGVATEPQIEAGGAVAPVFVDSYGGGSQPSAEGGGSLASIVVVASGERRPPLQPFVVPQIARAGYVPHKAIRWPRRYRSAGSKP